ncbi:MAG: hypothetical protein A3F24_02355 [Candidatus Colwellbacteria bacterium RIFCSPHIGHO2_12_FULL_44_17]|uniref:L,D-TPase catalytic domain-containing protein n=2 Tax=Candidatus Colwelliibacteriota TaxID=1817904 RepID=A0A1G1Z2S3_9BACT|nr:MAG: hypothetical protein A3F24_02355 [Candidatus Colwellbacteria bacterium RIFCSPHIGHO2_12_FULL_44_17]
MMRRFFSFPLPLWFILLLFAGIIIGRFALPSIYSLGLEDYNITLPEGPEGVSPLQYGADPRFADANFFASVREKFISEKLNFVEANLSTMELFVYREGNQVARVPIKTKGREGSWWETPTGLYKAEGKEEEHFSSIGRVYMPWSIPFQGNFFIHGWPYYADGTAVLSDFSGGCIRLSTEDAKIVYDNVQVGTPILIFEKDFEADSFRYEVSKPNVSATSYLVADLKSNVIIAEEDIDTSLPIASVTKLMTALVATEYINLAKDITITNSMITPTSLPRLKTGQNVTAFSLLYPLLLESSNEAALALSRGLGPVRFVELMNMKAKALGMGETRFVDPTGKESGNVSTSRELFQLAKYLYFNRSFVLNISNRKLYDLYGPLPFSGLKNFNNLLETSEFRGGKIGQTIDAGNTAISIFELPVRGETRPVVIIILGSKDYTEDTRLLFDWLREIYILSDEL